MHFLWEVVMNEGSCGVYVSHGGSFLQEFLKGIVYFVENVFLGANLFLLRWELYFVVLLLVLMKWVEVTFLFSINGLPTCGTNNSLVIVAK